MNKQRSFEFEDENFKSYQSDNIGIIKIKNDVYKILSQISESQEILYDFNYALRDTNIDILLLLNNPNCFSENEFDKQISKMLRHETADDTEEIITYKGFSFLREKQSNILNNFIRQMFGYRKPIIMGLCGEVVTPFMGASLTADIRFGSDNMYFSLSHMKYGLHASGALPFFLPKYVGQAKAAEILYRGGTISAEEALKLNLINEIFPVKDFENKCIIEAKKMCKINSSVLQSTRRLLNHYGEDLNNYLELEFKKNH